MLQSICFVLLFVQFHYFYFYLFLLFSLFILFPAVWILIVYLPVEITGKLFAAKREIESMKRLSRSKIPYSKICHKVSLSKRIYCRLGSLQFTFEFQFLYIMYNVPVYVTIFRQLAQSTYACSFARNSCDSCEAAVKVSKLERGLPARNVVPRMFPTRYTSDRIQ